MNSRYREFTAEGTYYEIGLQVGLAYGDELHRFIRLARNRIRETVNVTDRQLENICRDSVEYVRHYAPDYLSELQGMSDACQSSLNDLMLLQIRNQFSATMNLTEYPVDAGCTSVSVAAARSSEKCGMVGQNWDNDGALDEFTIVLTRRIPNRPAILTLTQVGLIAYIGFNEHGIGACLNSLPAPSRTVGVPHYFTLRNLLEQLSLETGVEKIARAQRVIPANIMLTTPDGPANLEVTLGAVHILDDEQTGLLTHTNHCLHPELCTINGMFPELIQSYPRKARIDQLLNPNPKISIEDLKRAFADHDGYPQSICRHQNNQGPHGCWETVFSVIMLPAQRRMLVTRGTPCEHSWEEYWLGRA